MELRTDDRQPITEQCSGCENITIDEYCECYLYPPAKWRVGDCPRASHLKPDLIKEQKSRVGQQKHRKKK